MDAIPRPEARVLWSFWIACGLALTGGILPFLLAAGGTNRIAGAAIPFGVAAMAFAAAALLYERGRPLATSLYFVAGIALVYGILFMIAVPLKLAVVGTCSPAPAICGSGLERPMSGGEESGLAIGIAMGMLAILVGFFGLQNLFRMGRQVAPVPPVRRETRHWVPPPEVTPPPATPEPEPATFAAPSHRSDSNEPAAQAIPVLDEPAKLVRKPRARRAPRPAPELVAPAEPLELAAPEEPLELPAPSSTSDAKGDADSAS